MSAQKHTPGPWGRNIAPAWKYPIIFAGRNTHVAYIFTNELSESEQEANANLIAAAPDLLQVTKDFLLLAALHDWEGAAIDFAKTTLAKAEGIK